MQLFIIRAILALLFFCLPVWGTNCYLLATGKEAFWAPYSLISAWITSSSHLFAYSSSYAFGCFFALAICLFWWLRWGERFYAFLLLFAVFMAGPTWNLPVQVFLKLFH